MDPAATWPRASVRRLFEACHRSRNPVLAFSRACSKVGWLARHGTVGQLAARGEQHALLILEGALNETKHALIAARLGKADAAIHLRTCNGELRAFERALRRIEERETHG
jgi:hypothetical protein